MNVTYGHWHGVAVEREDERDPSSALLIDVMHPASCAWSIDHHPRTVDDLGNVRSESFFTQQHTCDVQHELDEWGSDNFPDEPGFYWLRMEHVVTPAGPWGGSEYDVGIEWLPARRPSVQIEPGE